MANQAAYIQTARANPLIVTPAPTYVPGPGEVLIKNAVVAINPVDWKFQSYDPIKHTYPRILGFDVAGDIVSVGEGSRFKVGQRVVGGCLLRENDDPKYGAFQMYTVVNEITVSVIPDSMPYSSAVVLPLAISTAIAGLPDYLELPLPTIPPTPTDSIILIWGGSSSVGSSAIQLAVGSGLKVVSTASAANLDYVKNLGADQVFDYKKGGVVDAIVKSIKSTGGKFVGAFDAIGTPETLKSIGEAVHQLGGGKVASAHVIPEGVFPSDVTGKFVMVSTTAVEKKELLDYIWHEYIPAALANGQLLGKPDPVIVKGGLAKIQESIDLVKKGVSAAKVVVEL